MVRSYVLNSRYPIPRFFIWLMASWAISLTLFTLLGISIWMILGEPDHNLLDAFPRIISTLFGIWGLYTGIGAMALWITMWVYWATVERRSVQTRAVWFVALLFGMYYGALIYALILWNDGAIRAMADGPGADSTV